MVLRLSCVWAVLLAVGCAEIQYGGSGAGGTGGTGGGGTGLGGGGSGASGAAGGGGPTGGGGDGPGGEQCLNGADDDDDGLVDCADPECANASCIELPAGWLGPVALAQGPDCAGDFSNEIYELNASVAADPAACSCSCGGPTGACEDWVFRGFAAASCNNPSEEEQLIAGTCEGIASLANEDAYRLESDNGGPGGSCPASVSTTLPPIVPVTERICGTSGTPGGCDTGVCAPASLCIYQMADSACPAGFTKSLTGFQTITDTRGCINGCVCSTPNGDCAATVEVFGTNNCAGAVLTSALDQVCEPYGFSSLATYSVRAIADTSGVSCSALGIGTPNGSVSLSDPVTVCCSE